MSKSERSEQEDAGDTGPISAEALTVHEETRNQHVERYPYSL